MLVVSYFLRGDCMHSLYKVLAAGVLCTAVLVITQEVMVTRGVQKEAPESKGLGMEPNIGIVTNNRDAVSKLLNTLLADEYLVYVKTQNYHWNVTGVFFNDLHQFFGKQYGELACIIDMVAERVRALGGKAFGSMDEFSKYSRLKEQPGVVPADKEMLRNLLNDHESIIKTLRTDIESCSNEFQDEGTSNFLAELIIKHEKMAWMLRAYVS